VEAADPRTGKIVLGESMRRLGKERAGSLVRLQKRLDLPAQFVVAGTSLVEECALRSRFFKFAGPREYFLDVFRFVGHWDNLELAVIRV
jgi:hypothetical protein